MTRTSRSLTLTLILAAGGLARGPVAQARTPPGRPGGAASPADVTVVVRDPYQVRFMARPGKKALTIDQVLELVATGNPRIAEARQAIEAAEGGRLQAGLRPNPAFTTLLFNLNREIGTQTYQWVQTFETGSKRGKRKAVAGLGVEIARLDLADTERLVVNQARRLFMTVLRALSDVEFAIETLRNYERFTGPRDPGEAGDSGQLIRISNERLDLENELDRAILAVELAKHDLGELMARPEMWQEFDVDGGLEFLPTDFRFEDLHRAAFAHRPDWHRADHEVAQARARLRLAEAGLSWNVSAGPSVTHVDGSDRLNLGMFMNVNPQVFDRNQGGIAQARANVERALQGREQVRLRLERELRKEFDRYRINSKILKNYLRRYLDDTRLALERAQGALGSGRISITDYLDTLRTYRNVNIGYRAALASYLISINDLNLVCGTELVSIDDAITLGERVTGRSVPSTTVLGDRP